MAAARRAVAAADEGGGARTFPGRWNWQGVKVEDLRYGENPHQAAAFYRDEPPVAGAIAAFRQLQGKELSYNNIADSDAAWECARSPGDPACVIVKHANPCGVALGGELIDAYRKAFAGFDPRKVARFTSAAARRLMKDEGIVRNRLKIQSAITNAQAFLAVQKEFGTFDAYVWRFVGGAPKQNARKSLRKIPPRTPESDALSRDLKQRGFRFVGSTICYAFMQGCGLVNDHVTGCFRHAELGGKRRAR